MMISTRGRYGLRIMFEIACHYKDGPVPMSVIADNQDLTKKYIHILLRRLMAKKLVKSIRGAAGGYQLTRPPAQINLLEVFEAVEGPIVLVACMTSTKKCGRYPVCPTHPIWVEIRNSMRQSLMSKTVQDMVVHCPKREAAKASA